MKKFILPLFVLSTVFVKAQNTSDEGIVAPPPDNERDEKKLNLDGNDQFYIYETYSDVNLAIARKEKNNRTFSAVVEYNSRKKITPFIFESIYSNFRENGTGTAALNSKFGVIDKKGKMIIPFIYDEISHFTLDGKIHYRVRKNGLWGVLTERNEVLVPVEYEYLWKAYGTNNYLELKKNGKSGLMDVASKKMIIPLLYDEVELLKVETYIKVRKDKDFTLFKLNGEQAFANWYQQLDIKGQALLVELKGKKGLIDFGEKKLVPFEYEKMELVEHVGSDRLFIVSKSGKQGIIDKEGKVLVPIKYDQLQTTLNTQVIVTKESKTGMLSIEGKQLLPLEYDEIKQSNEKYLVKKNNKYGLFSREGSFVLPVEYDFLRIAYLNGDYTPSVFIGSKNGKKGVVDVVTGKPRIEFVYDNIIGMKSNWASYEETLTNANIAVKNGKYGMIDLYGKELIPFEYNDLQYISSSVVIANKDGKYGIREIYNGGNVLLPFEYSFLSEKNDVIIGYKNSFEKFRINGGKITPLD